MLEAQLSRIEETLRKRAKALLQQGGADRRTVVFLGPDHNFRRALTLNRLTETKGTIISNGLPSAFNSETVFPGFTARPH